MRTLSIRQPWAWLILNAGKNIENRSWSTKYRGPILIHASKGMTRAEYEAAKDPLWHCRGLVVELPGKHEMDFGGIVGRATIVDCVTTSDSDWFCGPFGFVLADVEPLPFFPCRGQLGFFEVNL